MNEILTAYFGCESNNNPTLFIQTQRYAVETLCGIVFLYLRGTHGTEI